MSTVTCNGVTRNDISKRRCLAAGVWRSRHYPTLAFCDEHKTPCCFMSRVILGGAAQLRLIETEPAAADGAPR